VCTVVRGIGELLLTAGVVVLLFSGYLLYGTAWETDRDQRSASAELDRQWAALPGPDAPAAPAPPVDAPANGEPVARLHVPRFGRAFTVLEGTGQAVLARGPGHYPGTALPGGIGNTAVAGHRVGHGAPFDPADTLRSCDPVVVESRDTWWVYRVLPLPGEEADWALSAGTRPGCAGVVPVGVPGREVVDPADRTVIAAVPGRPTAVPQLALLTLTTCNPRFSARQRLIVHAVLVRAQPRAAGRPAELAAAGEA
jgi:sortase A